MRRSERVATWLDLAIAPHRGGESLSLCLHPIGRRCDDPDEQCYAVSVDGRWLCSSNGRLTVLQGLGTAEHFMRLINVPSYETGDPADFEIELPNCAHCISMNCNSTLGNCEFNPSGLH